MFYRLALPSALLFAVLTPAVQAQQSSSGAGMGAVSAVPAAEVAAVRAATEKYRDVAVAIAEGYVEHPVCMTSSMEGAPKQLGAMGYHYFRPDLLGITGEKPRVNGTGTHTDFARPGILVYEPRSDGSLELVALENLVWVKAWEAAGHSGPPEFHGNQYYHTIDNPATEVDEAHGFEPHYELHWWLYRANPSGEFAPFNPRVSCAHAAAHSQS